MVSFHDFIVCYSLDKKQGRSGGNKFIMVDTDSLNAKNLLFC